jgi:hypothetical protein
VWKGPDYSNTVSDPNNWQARLYQERVTFQHLKGNEPVHRDLSPRVHALPNPPHSTAPGVYPSPQYVDDLKTRAVRFLIPARQAPRALPRTQEPTVGEPGLLRGVTFDRFGLG